MTESEHSECLRSCERLCTDFAHFVDTRRYDDFVELFVVTGTFSRGGMTFEGHDGIKRFLENRPETAFTRHLCCNIRVEPLAPDSARGTSHALMFASHREGDLELPLKSQPPVLVDYLDEYVLTPKGWRIRSRLSRPALVLAEAAP